MITISKNEMEYLVSKGCRWQHDLHKSYSGHNKYWMTEDKRLMQMLKTYRENNTHSV